MTPLQRLEQVVVDALIARGMSEGEAKNMVDRLKNSAVSKFNGGDEIEVNGNLVALNPVTFERRLPNSILVTFQNAERIIPLSQVDVRSEIHAKSRSGDIGIMIITKWIAEKKGIV
jgi:hypothetical protein